MSYFIRVACILKTEQSSLLLYFTTLKMRSHFFIIVVEFLESRNSPGTHSKIP